MPESSHPAPLANPTPPMRMQVLAISLTAVAGYVDAAGFLLLSQIYTANMSGNSVSLGIRIAQHSFDDMGRRALPIGAFFVGLVASSAVHEAAKLRRFRHPFAIMFAVEFLLLAGFTGAAFPLHPAAGQQPGTFAFCLLAGLAGTAMGVQNASLRRAGALTIHTTHVTGLLLQCSDALVIAAVALMRPCTWKARRDAFGNAALLFGLWFVYVGGAIAGALLLAPLGPAILAPAMVVLALWLASDLMEAIPT
ncbi:MAG TPA: YoaK family protein [Phycisphaerae bacterium]|nr:YoaK family protein [Phycisphaerae bacterium]